MTISGTSQAASYPNSTMPAATPFVAGGGQAITGQPLVTGEADPAAAAAANGDGGGGVDSLDAAIARQLGTEVAGGGAPGSSDPSGGIPAFVRGFLPDEAGAPAEDAISSQQQTQSGPPGKQGSTASRSGVQQGWAWIEAGPPQKYGPPVQQDPGWTQVCLPGSGWPEAPPMKGTPPSKGEPPTQGPPPSKGEPPQKGEPPVQTDPPAQTPPAKTEAPQQTEQVAPTPADRGTYTVVKGDSLAKIGKDHDVSWQQMYWANKDQIEHPDLIYPGQVLQIPSPDLEVPPFDYTPMFPVDCPPEQAPPAKTEPPAKQPEPTPPPKAEEPAPPPAKAEPPAKTEPPQTPPKTAPTETTQAPPGSDPGASAQNPPAPPVPTTTGTAPGKA